MNTPFESLPKEDIEDWRMHPVTKALVATLQDQRNTLAEQIVQRVQCDEIGHAAVRGGGMIMSLDFMLNLIKEARR